MTEGKRMPGSPSFRALCERVENANAGTINLGASIILIALNLTACGYHTAAHNVTLPENVKTIAIPTFRNETQTYKIEQRLTAAVVKEMNTRTHYHVVASDSADADATLKGAVLAMYTTPLTYDSQTGRAASVLVVVNVSVTLTSKDGKVLYTNPSYLLREQYQVSTELTSFFEEDTPAMQRLSNDFAQTLVSNILEGF
jgi:outer membrane lipopolysaccharide assembly protein LptE/RlpB